MIFSFIVRYSHETLFGDVDYRIQIFSTLTEFVDIKLVNLLSTLPIFHMLRDNILMTIIRITYGSKINFETLKFIRLTLEYKKRYDMADGNLLIQIR